ncbi:MAG: patatin-like phospholipase family protein [Candidatus Competibacterales bacterium]
MTPKKINLALQGGGAHGAYTWGVLDRVLEDERLVIEGISGTSAGAMNAAVLVQGYMRDGNAGARRALEDFWHRIAASARFTPFRTNPLAKWLWNHPWNLDRSPSYRVMDALARLVSPYFSNPLDHNPLQRILEQVLDIATVNSCSRIQLFVTATRVRDGRARVFQCHEIGIDALLASACLPQLFQAVVIDGEAYWDGGFMGNPAIWPLIYGCRSPDVMLVQINPMERDEIPVEAAEIINRVNEITFNASLLAEMRAIEFVSRLIQRGKLEPSDGYKQMRVHLVERPAEMIALNASSKLNVDWDFLVYLKNLGRRAADDWLAANYDHLGQEGCNIQHTFLETHQVPGPAPRPSTSNVISFPG